MKSFYKNKKVLITGGTGMVGRQLVSLLLEDGAKVTVASMDSCSGIPSDVEFQGGNLMQPDFCKLITKGQDIVFQVAGIKGSVSLGKKRAASFFTPTILMNTLMMDAAYRAGVERYLYTSTVGIYPPADIFHEDNGWNGPPYEIDKYAGWAKRMGELQAEAYQLEYGWNKIAIVRPTNIYGPYDNFDPNTAMVIPALIARSLSGENPLKVWGDGSPIRDFIFSKDCAIGMMLALEKVDQYNDGTILPINLGGSEEVSIKQVAELICSYIPNPPKLEFDLTKPKGQALRILNKERAFKLLNFFPETSIIEGIKQTIDWYLKNKTSTHYRYNVFNQTSFV